MIVVVASEKGGTGKTTLSTNLAILRAKNAADVLLVDADPQNSASDFAAVRDQENHQPQITCVTLLGQTIANELRKMAPRFDDIVVDVGGRDTATLRGALLVADVLVVPFLPSQLDAWSAERMDNLVGEVQQLNEKIRPLAILNKVDTNPKIGLIDEALSFAAEFKHLTLLSCKIGYRVSYRRSVAEGLSVAELSPKKDPKSIEEMKKLYEEVFGDA